MSCFFWFQIECVAEGYCSAHLEKLYIEQQQLVTTNHSRSLSTLY